MEKIDSKISYLFLIIFLVGFSFTLAISYISDMNGSINKFKHIKIIKIISVLMIFVFLFTICISTNIHIGAVIVLSLAIGISGIFYVVGIDGASASLPKGSNVSGFFSGMFRQMFDLSKTTLGSITNGIKNLNPATNITRNFTSLMQMVRPQSATNSFT